MPGTVGHGRHLTARVQVADQADDPLPGWRSRTARSENWHGRRIHRRGRGRLNGHGRQ